MEKHIKAARAHRALSWLYALIGILFLIIYFTPSGVSTEGALSLAIFFLAIFALHHFTARGAREKKPWAQNTSRVIAVLMVPGFPFGTLVGIYLLVNSWSSWVIEPTDA